VRVGGGKEGRLGIHRGGRERAKFTRKRGRGKGVPFQWSSEGRGTRWMMGKKADRRGRGKGGRDQFCWRTLMFSEGNKVGAMDRAKKGK